MGALEQDLVWDADGDALDVAGGKLLTSAALNRAVALFVGSNSLSIQISSAHQESCGAGLHEKDVNLSFVPFDLAVRFPMNQQEGLMGEIYKCFTAK